MGQVHWLRGAYGQALDFHRQALAIRRALGDRRSIALSLANIGRVHHDSGNFKAAIAQFREALDLRRDIGDLSGVVQSLCDLGRRPRRGRQPTSSRSSCSARRRTIAEEIGDKLALDRRAVARWASVKAAMGRGSEAVARPAARRSRWPPSLGDRVALAVECCRRLAEVQLGWATPARPRRDARAALAISEEVGTARPRRQRAPRAGRGRWRAAGLAGRRPAGRGALPPRGRDPRRR